MSARTSAMYSYFTLTAEMELSGNDLTLAPGENVLCFTLPTELPAAEIYAVTRTDNSLMRHNLKPDGTIEVKLAKSRQGLELRLFCGDRMSNSLTLTRRY